MENKKTVGVVVGRFQPLHMGHLNLIWLALTNNDLVKIAIGSSQASDPLPASVRRERLMRTLTSMGVESARYEIYDLPDIHNLPRWPAYLKRVCAISDDAKTTYYASDGVSEEFKKYLEQAGFEVCLEVKKPFIFHDPFGGQYFFTSATEIRELYRRLGIMDKI